MANPKLWWNGSQWKTSSAKWVNTSKQGSYQLGIGMEVKIIAYDDLSIKMTSAINAYQTASIYNNVYWAGTITFKSGSTTIGTNAFSDKTITNYSSISYSGTVYAYGNASGTVYGSGALSFSGSTSIASPFRTITYDVNGGVGSPGTQKVLTGITTKVTPAEAPTRENYEFVGWNTAVDGSGDSYNTNANISISANTTLYAQWSQTAFKVTINADEGSIVTFNGQSYNNVSNKKVYVESGTYPVVITAESGYMIKTRSPASDGNVNISNDSTVLSATSQHVGCHVYDGSQWQQYVIYVYSGSQWEIYQAYMYDGGQWNLVY